MSRDEYMKEIAERYDLKELNKKLKETIEYVKTHKYEDME